MPTVRRRYAALTILTTALAGLAGAVGLAAPAAAAAPALVSFSLSAPTVDVTNGAVPVTARVVFGGPLQFTPALYLDKYVPAAGSRADLAPPLIHYDNTWEPLTQETILQAVAGQANTYEATLPIPAGLNGRQPLTLAYDGTTLTATDLAARGFTATITAVTTKLPPAPTKLKGQTITRFVPDLIGIPRLNVYSKVSYTMPAGAVPRLVEVVSASPSCGYGHSWPLFDPAKAWTIFNDRTPGVCTVKLRSVNGAGVSATASVSFI